MTGYVEAFGQQPGKPRLATVMQEVSYGCSIDAATFRGMVQSVDARLDEQTVAEVLGMMAQTTPTAVSGSNPASLSPEQLTAVSATLAAIANGGVSPTPGAQLGDGSNSGVVGWAWKVVIDVIKSVNSALNWVSVAEHLDHPGFIVPSAEGFQLLVYAYRYGAGEQVPVKTVVGRKWANEVGQLSLLKYAVSAPPDIFSFQASERKMPPVEGLQGGKSPAGTPNQAWLSVDLLQIMCHFTVDTSKRPTVLAMLEYPIKHCPEVLLLSMASVPEDTPILQREVYSILLPPYLKDANANTQLVLRRLLEVNPKLIKEMLLEYYLHDKEHLPRIHEICQELKALPMVLSETPSCRFALHLAVYAFQVKQSVNLEQWALARLVREPVALVYDIMLFLYAKTIVLQSDPAQQARVLGRLSDETVQALVRVLTSVRPQLAGDFLDGYNQLSELMGQAYPGLKQVLQAPLFAPDVEAEAKGYLQRLHAHPNLWEEVFTHVQKLRASGNQRDKDLFDCFTHHLLSELPAYLYDEYKDLQAVAMLISALLTQQVWASHGVGLGMALRFVLFSLRQPLGSRPFAFGLTVLRVLIARSPKLYSAFCEQVILTAQVREADPELFGRIELALREFHNVLASHPEQLFPLYTMLPAVNLPLEAGQVHATQQIGGIPVASPSKSLPPPMPGPPPGMGGPPAQPVPSLQPQPAQPTPVQPQQNSMQSWGTGAGTGAVVQGSFDKGKSMEEGNDIEGELEASLLAAPPQTAVQSKGMLNVNTVSLENASEKHNAPCEQVQDNIHFTVNNLSQDNVDSKAADIKAKVIPDYRGWFCEYMAKRAAQEHNYQGLYIRLLDKLNDKPLMKQLIRSTYFYVRLLLTGDRAVKESNDRQLLKNLGHWLGHLTLKRNKPLLSRELELKQIVVEAYQRGRLVSVLPFVANLLSVCEKSQVFTPTNPMISGLLSLLAELHKLPQLKFNGQYCIEMVFKTFGNPVVEPTNLLANLPRDTLNNADFSNVAEDTMDKGLMSAEATSNMQAMMNAAAVKAFNQNVMGNRTPSKMSSMAPGMGNGTPGGPGAAPGAMMQGMTPGASGMPGAQMMQGMTPGGPGMSAAQQGAMAMSMMQSNEASKQEAMAMRAAALTPGGGMAAGGAVGTPPPGTPMPAGAQTPPQPTGLCMEHNAMIQFLSQNAIINPSLGAIAERLLLKRHVPTAIERAIWEILNPVVERSVTIACSTTCELLAKDFALDGDEIRMRKAAHLMVSSLAGSLSLVTCKDPLRIALTNHLSQLINTTQTPNTAAVEKSMLEQVVTVVVQDNLEACCQVFERAATEKAVRDADKQLQEKYDERINAKKMNRPFQGDNSAFHGRFPAQLPESLRPRPGVVSAMQLRVYEDFARIPRVPPPAAAAPTAMPGMRPYGVEDGKDGNMPGGPGANVMHEAQYLQWQQVVDAALAKGEANNDQSELQSLMQELLDFASPAVHEETCHLFIQRIFRHLFEVASTGGSKLALNFYTMALRHLAEIVVGKGGQPVALTALWANAEDERKFSRDAVEGLIRAGLLNPPELDGALARAVPRSSAAVELVVHLIKNMILRGDQSLVYTDIGASVEALGIATKTWRASNIPAQVAAADQHGALVDQARRSSPAALQPQRAPTELPACVRDANDSAGAKDQVLKLFEEWLRISQGSPGFLAYASNPAATGVSEADRAAVVGYLNTLRASGCIKDESSSERWVRLCIDLVVNHSQSMVDQGRTEPHQMYYAVDGLSRLLACITVHVAGLPFLRSALAILVGVIKRDADDRSVSFNGRPHLRLLVGLMAELPGGNTPNSSSPEALDPTALRYLRAVAEALHALQPLSVPGWAFCWLTAIAHRSLMPRLLLSPTQHGWLLYEHLLVALLRFLEPYLRASSELTDCVRALYKGTLRLLLVLLHDFPEFLCEHHFPLCDAIPVSCVQLRNLVLSAFPRSMRLPDPFTPGLKVDLLAEINQPPRMLPEPDRLLERHGNLRNSLDTYLTSRQPASLPLDLARMLKLPSGTPEGKTYNTSLINAVVLYIGATSRSPATPTADGPAMEIFIRLMDSMDSEGRYLVLNAAANQLRYPNSHTYYFSCMLLTLFAEVKADVVKEQITRVLLERLVVNRPHPWGLLITFIELIKNQRYNFWAHDFTRNGADVERLFKNVAHSCMAHGTAPGGPGAKDGVEGQ